MPWLDHLSALNDAVLCEFGESAQPVASDGATPLGAAIAGVFDPIGSAPLEAFALPETDPRLVDQAHPTLQVLPTVAAGLSAGDLLAIRDGVFAVTHIHRADAGGMCLVELEER